MIEDVLPQNEQTYKIPNNWNWVRLEEVCGGFQYGHTEKATFEKVESRFTRITD